MGKITVLWLTLTKEKEFPVDRGPHRNCLFSSERLSMFLLFGSSQEVRLMLKIVRLIATINTLSKR